MPTIADRYAAAQRAAITAAAERAVLTGEGTAASTGPTLEGLAAAHAGATRIDRYLDAVEAHAPAELARLSAIYDATRDRAVLRRLIILQGCAEAVGEARAVLDDLPLLTDLVAAQNGGPLTNAMYARGFVVDYGGHMLSARALSVLQLIAAAVKA